MGVFLALKTRICLFRPLFCGGPGAGTAQSLLLTSFVCLHVCVMCAFEYASTNRTFTATEEIPQAMQIRIRASHHHMHSERTSLRPRLLLAVLQVARSCITRRIEDLVGYCSRELLLFAITAPAGARGALPNGKPVRAPGHEVGTTAELSASYTSLKRLEKPAKVMNVWGAFVV